MVVHTSCSGPGAQQQPEPIAFVNGKLHKLPLGRAEVTLLTFLRGAPARCFTEVALYKPCRSRRAVFLVLYAQLLADKAQLWVMLEYTFSCQKHALLSDQVRHSPCFLTQGSTGNQMGCGMALILCYASFWAASAV